MKILGSSSSPKYKLVKLKSQDIESERLGTASKNIYCVCNLNIQEVFRSTNEFVLHPILHLSDLLNHSAVHFFYLNLDIMKFYIKLCAVKMRIRF